MKLKRKSFGLFASIASMLATFPACPPNGGPLAIDMMDYWPMAKGNFWTYQSKTDPDVETIYTVVEDLSTPSDPAFALQSSRYRNGQLVQTTIQYYIWRHDFLVRTPSRDKADDVLADPNAATEDLNIEVELPRYTYPSNTPRLFIDEGAVERRYTVTGVLNQLYGMYECPNDVVPPLPAYLPVVQSTPGVYHLGENTCDGVVTITGSRFLVEGVGPVEQFIGFLTSYGTV